MSDGETFRRGQVTWALWQTFSHHNAADPRRAAVPQAFATRVRKLQEFGVPLPPGERPGRAGVDARYTPYQAFEIGVGLDMQDNGLNQAEIGYFLRNVRPELRGAYDRIVASPPVLHGRLPARSRPASPPAVHVGGADPEGLGDPRRRGQADTAVFMAFRYVEVREAWNTPAFDGAGDWEGKGPPPFFLRPAFHFGLRSLMKEMDRLAVSVGDRIRTVVELGNLAVALLDNLSRAPPIRRGRP